MAECNKCGGQVGVALSDLEEGQFACTCISFNDKLDKDEEWKRNYSKMRNKRNAEHWKNGREEHND